MVHVNWSMKHCVCFLLNDKLIIFLKDVWPQEKFSIDQNLKRWPQNDLVFQKEIRNPPIKIQRKKGGDAL